MRSLCAVSSGLDTSDVLDSSGHTGLSPICALHKSPTIHKRKYVLTVALAASLQLGPFLLSSANQAHDLVELLLRHLHSSEQPASNSAYCNMLNSTLYLCMQRLPLRQYPAGNDREHKNRLTVILQNHNAGHDRRCYNCELRAFKHVLGWNGWNLSSD